MCRMCYSLQSLSNSLRECLGVRVYRCLGKAYG